MLHCQGPHRRARSHLRHGSCHSQHYVHPPKRKNSSNSVPNERNFRKINDVKYVERNPYNNQPPKNRSLISNSVPNEQNLRNKDKKFPERFRKRRAHRRILSEIPSNAVRNQYEPKQHRRNRKTRSQSKSRSVTTFYDFKRGVFRIAFL